MTRRNLPVWIAIASTSLLCLVELHALNASVGVLTRSRMEDTQMATSRWREINGVVTNVTTYRELMQTEPEFVEKHMTAVEAMTKRLNEEARSEHVEHR